MKLFRWFAFALTALAATALSAPVIVNGKRELIVWGIIPGPDTKGLEAVIHAFAQENPDVDVRVMSMGAGGMDPQKQTTAIVGGAPPDVIQQDRFSMSDWASRGAFQALDDLIARDRGVDPLCPFPEQFYPAAWEESCYGGHVYGIPIGADDRALYWNRAMFRAKADELRKAGLDPNRPPRTWSECKSYNKVLTEFRPDGGIKQAGFMPNFGNSWLYMYAFENDAPFVSADGRRCTLDNPASEEALQFMLECYDQLGGYEKAKSFEAGFGVRELDGFYSGRIAMKIDGDWGLNSLSRYKPDLDFAVAPSPIPDDRYRRVGRFAGLARTEISWMGGFCQVIPRGARNVEDAWRFIKFEASLKGRRIDMTAQRKWEESRGRMFVPRIQANRAANDMALKEFAPANPKFRAALAEHIDLMPVAAIRPPSIVGQLLWDAHVGAMDKALRKQLSPKQALLQGQETVQRELDAFYTQYRYAVVDTGNVIVGGVILFVAAMMGLVVAFRRKRLGRLATREAKWGYILISPWIIGFLALTLGPMLASLFFSFTRYNVMSPPRWIGGNNYAEMFTTDRATFFKAFANAFYLAGIGVPLSLMTGLAIALLLNTATRGIRFYRTFFYMPSIVPTTASAVLWSWILAPDATKGLLSAGWSRTLQPWLGVSPPAWITSENWAKDSLIVMGMWGAGSGMILWLAGLKGIPNQLYEASAIDGATPRQQFWRITMPQLSPIIFFNLIVGGIGALQEFDRIFVMKSDDGTVGPADAWMTPVYHLFQNGFGFFRMGYASALAWAIFVVILALTLAQFRIGKQWVHYEAER